MRYRQLKCTYGFHKKIIFISTDDEEEEGGEEQPEDALPPEAGKGRRRLGDVVE